jgi:hypothetical protein
MQSSGQRMPGVNTIGTAPHFDYISVSCEVMGAAHGGVIANVGTSKDGGGFFVFAQDSDFVSVHGLSFRWSSIPPAVDSNTQV